MPTLPWIAGLLLVTGQYGVPAVSDADLAGMRGGFSLPGGLDVALTVQTQTTLDGAIVLRTVFRAEGGRSQVSAYAPAPGTTVAAQARDAAGRAPVAAPTVRYDARTGVTITPAQQVPVSVGGTAASDLPAGLVAVGVGDATDHGTIAARPGMPSVELRGADLNITHLMGRAFGSAIGNSGNDRAIDTQTVVGIDLRGAGPDVLGSSMLRVQEAGIDAMRIRQ